MASQQYTYPPPLVPGPQASVHPVDSHQDLAQGLEDEAPQYKSYRGGNAPQIQRARKDFNRGHRVIDGDWYGPSIADGTIIVPKLGFGAAQTSLTVPAQAPSRASQPSPQAHTHTSVFSSSRIPTQDTSIPHPSHPTPDPQTPPPSQIPTPAPTHHSTHISHVHLPENSRSSFFSFPGPRFPKHPLRHDSIDSTGFIHPGQLDNDVAAHLIKYVENPRTVTEQIKQKIRQLWHGSFLKMLL
ncbi:hypothetical protein DE146DRAFT_632065 [Phaeosphaeria sp. MPI-PUGE-AT-0046c]|nr:hypothetical protein DE146DRAFT_632065 [Phaeosphaeria sp. MPI-PUGE-AT-0046c]